MADYLKTRGSSIRSIRRQIQGEIAWRRLQSKRSSTVSVGDEEVQAVINKLNASKGAEEFRVGEIFLSANSSNEAEVQANMGKLFKRCSRAARLSVTPANSRSLHRRLSGETSAGCGRNSCPINSPTRSSRCARA